MKTSLLLLPGLLCDAELWQPQIAALPAACSVAEYGDARSIAAMAEAALAAAPPGPLAVAGHSMGGRVALEICRRAPERVQRLALLNTGCLPLPEGEAGAAERAGRLRFLELARRDGMRAMALDWVQGTVHESRRPGPVVDTVVEMFARRTPAVFEAQIEALLTRPDYSPLLPQLRCTTLLLTGSDDRLTPPETHAEMRKRIPGASHVVIGRCGHMAPLESPAAVNAALGAWLAA
ncbi:pimeloyl-ACP methyl ester carboxylesterase [Rubrivivax gelatinosus]|uniref:alpha/beta fold hydrolase n=1 Tax=Rubrivivax gelatinosus TaxID=28068 RepID=UPI0018C93BCA|nr:alpha/beta hydrolase [Rubrivivax gelatinosus]MBG6080702.1 pimeloyl-ACP methyl ester carboxylesterase [Rubrivivax gelatinosus]